MRRVVSAARSGAAVTGRTALAVVGAAIAVLAVGTPAWADVTITPTEAVQGGAARLTFRVGDGPGSAYTTKVEVQLPEDLPVAEVYPMSVSDWAPQMTSRTLDRPIEGIHGSGATTVTAGITWTRVTGPPPKPGIADLSLSLGPLPQADRLPFAVVQTMSDGSVRRWAQSPSADGKAPNGPGPVLALRPSEDAGAGDAQEEAPAPGEAAGSAGSADGADGSAGADTDDSAPTGYVVAGLIGALLVGLIAVAWFVAGRWLSPSDQEDAPENQLQRST